VISPGLARPNDIGSEYVRICLLSDSLSMPRLPEAGNITYEQTYPYKLTQLFAEQIHNQHFQVIPLASRGRTIVNTYQSLQNELFQYRPLITVLQVGIVDCAPRVFTPREHRLVNRMGPLKEPILKFVHVHRRRIIATLPPKVYVSLKEFSTTARKLKGAVLAYGSALVVVNIAPTCPETAHRSPDLERNILRYNKALAAICGENVPLVDIFAAIQQQGIKRMILDDGIHLSAPGNALVANMLRQKILSVMNRLTEKK